MKLSDRTILVIGCLALCLGFFYGQNYAQAANFGDIVINEIYYDPVGTDTGKEWIELHNVSTSGINLTDWKFYEAETNHALSLIQGDWVLPVGSYAIIADKADQFLTDHLGFNGVVFDSSFFLNNTSESIAIKDNNKAVIDEVTYQNSWGGNSNGKTIEKQNNFWAESLIDNGTPGAVNSGQTTPPLADENPSPPENPATSTPSADQINANYRFGDVVINEFVPDPADEEVEWVELYNKRAETINLDGWFLYDGSGAKTSLSGVLEKYLAVEKPKGNLNNAGDLIILKQGDNIIDQVAYGNWDDGNADDNAPSASDPKAIARTGDGYNTYNNKNDFAVTATVTKGGANIIADVDAADLETRLIASLQPEGASDIIISEILPQPRGDENEGEFIELFNKSNQEVNLKNWALGDSSTRKYTIKKIDAARNDSIIKPQGYFVVYRAESKIALNNSGDEVQLYEPNKETPAQTVKYDKSVEGQSYNVKNATSTPLIWQWSEVITPGAFNIIQLKHTPAVDFGWSGEPVVGQIIFFDSADTADADGDDLTYLWNFGTGTTATEANPIYIYLAPGNFPVSLAASDGEHTVKEEKIIKIKEVKENVPPTAASTSKIAAVKGAKVAGDTKSSNSTSAKKNTAFTITPLENIRELATGSYVKVEGTVAVKPGIFSTQYFYIVGSPGVQIYNNKKLFPALAVGDKVVAAGQLSESYGELRLKTKVASDIKKIATSTLPTPTEILTDEIGEETESQLVRVSGTVVDKKGSSIWLDDGNGEAEIYFKQGTKIDKTNINEGDAISVIGIVSQSNDKYRILPRSQQDIITGSGAAQIGEVLGEISASDSWQLAQNNKKMKLIEYLLVLAGGLIIVLIGVIWKYKKNLKK